MLFLSTVIIFAIKRFEPRRRAGGGGGPHKLFWVLISKNYKSCGKGNISGPRTNSKMTNVGVDT